MAVANRKPPIDIPMRANGPIPLPTSDDLPYDDGEPMDSFLHVLQMQLLKELIESAWAGRDFFTGGDMFIYFSNEQVFHKDFRGPDFFVVTGVDHDKPRHSFVSLEEGNRLPDVIVELISPKTEKVDRVVKKDVYARMLRTPEYFLFDDRDNGLEGFRLSNRKRAYEPIPPEPNGRVYSEQLDMYLGLWDGKYLNHPGTWLRFFDKGGRLIPTFAESEAKRAESEAMRAAAAEAEVARLKAELEKRK
jgi:Uma2 family endonuclease